ncbi:MAG: GNAT family N-acetyltransferase [Candidatus Nanopelagicales bacterium]|nr:GNAT family N-acetyltransferase [Candidatus Nanopelagicales bacterium]MDZ4248958.1 GNAT family N-acetyltransferase [Candidatus Nanopelagicales bacterium]
MAHWEPVGSPRVWVRNFTVLDISEEYLGALNDREHMKFSDQRLLRHDAASCRRYLASFDGTPNLFLAVEDRSSGDLVGTITAYVDPDTRTADIGILVFPRRSGTGVGTDAWRLVIHELMRSMRISEVTAGTAAGNLAMRRLIDACGMSPRRGLGLDVGRSDADSGCETLYFSTKATDSREEPS